MLIYLNYLKQQQPREIKKVYKNISNSLFYFSSVHLYAQYISTTHIFIIYQNLARYSAPISPYCIYQSAKTSVKAFQTTAAAYITSSSSLLQYVYSVCFKHSYSR